MAGLDIRLKPEALRSINTATFTGAYLPVGTPLANASRIVKFTNNSNRDITISWDGIVDVEFVPMGSFLLIDVASNRQFTAELCIPEGTQFYAKGSAGAGSLYISTYYA